jgi:hypothetical protein
MPREIRSWDRFSATNPSQSEAKLAFVTLNGSPLTVTRSYMEGKPQNLEVEVDGVGREVALGEAVALGRLEED